MPAGLPGDPVEFTVFTEIAIIAHLSDNLFAHHLPDGLTVAQFGVLNHLLHTERQESIGELARTMQVSQPTMSSTVRKLEDKKLIRLVSSDTDRRVRRVSVTKQGLNLRNKAIGQIQPLRGAFADHLDQNDWERLLPLLTKLRVILDQMRP